MSTNKLLQWLITIQSYVCSKFMYIPLGNPKIVFANLITNHFIYINVF